MKRFNLEAAKQGKPVCTKDGKKARIICFDKKGDYPIVALVESKDGEQLQDYKINGVYSFTQSEHNLCMADDTKPIKWRKTIDGAVYVHSELGSDTTGDGSQEKPYKTLKKAGVITEYKKAVCIGYFSEDMNGKGWYGYYGSEIIGDYYGAAVYDGQFKYTTWGVTMTDMIIINVTSNAGGGLAGVGRAVNYYGHVSDAICVYGVASAPNFIHNCYLHFGCIGGNSAVKNIVYSKVLPNSDECKIWLGNGWEDKTLQQSTVYDVEVQERMMCRTKSKRPKIDTTIFAKFAMIVNDNQDFENCLFTADCKWYIFENHDYDSKYTEVTGITGDTSEERYESLVERVKELGGVLNVTFKNCIFSPQTSDEIFNDAEKLDFTLKPYCDAILETETECGCRYIGALPPVVNFLKIINEKIIGE
ncbi:MAG: hypothetical protein K5860_07765 [Bacteroidales bacterium]|nr:hypothetical protein [Bacteroidales bacterium]